MGLRFYRIEKVIKIYSYHSSCDMLLNPQAIEAASVGREAASLGSGYSAGWMAEQPALCARLGPNRRDCLLPVAFGMCPRSWLEGRSAIF